MVFWLPHDQMTKQSTMVFLNIGQILDCLDHLQPQICRANFQSGKLILLHTILGSQAFYFIQNNQGEQPPPWGETMLFSCKGDGQIRGGPMLLVFYKGGLPWKEATSGLIKAKYTTVINKEYFIIYFYVIMSTFFSHSFHPLCLNFFQ